MSDENMVFRSVYVDPAVDAALRAQAADDGVSKGEMFRRVLQRGMRSKRATALPLDANARLCLRTVYLPVQVDDVLRSRAFDLRTSKSDLIRRYLIQGMAAIQRTAERQTAGQT